MSQKKLFLMSLMQKKLSETKAKKVAEVLPKLLNGDKMLIPRSLSPSTNAKKR